MILIVTAYCACQLCCGPQAKGITASGVKPVEGITCAAPFPFGTRLHIEGIGWRRVEDRTAPRYRNRIDVYFRSHNQAKEFGKRKAVVEAFK